MSLAQVKKDLPQALCMTCKKLSGKKQSPMVPVEVKKTSKGSYMILGLCAEHGTKMARIIGKDSQKVKEAEEELRKYKHLKSEVPKKGSGDCCGGNDDEAVAGGEGEFSEPTFVNTLVGGRRHSRKSRKSKKSRKSRKSKKSRKSRPSRKSRKSRKSRR
jgi:hypothetical protein